MYYPDVYEGRLTFETEHVRIPILDAAKHPIIAAVNSVAAELLDILGPMLWAALIVLFLVAEFSSS